MHNFDQVIVTGCSFSCGTEMNDSLLPTYASVQERQASIWRWAKQNINMNFDSVDKLHSVSNQKWEEMERAMSWPVLLEKKIKTPVINLSKIGSSTGRSLVTFSAYIREQSHKAKNKSLVIHQLPSYARMYIRFNQQHGRINVLPTDMEQNKNFGFDKAYFQKNISKVREHYKSKTADQNFLVRYTNIILQRLEKLSVENSVANYYILPEKNDAIDLPKNKIIIEDFSVFRANYPKGLQGHPIGLEYNNDLCDKIIATFGH